MKGNVEYLDPTPSERRRAWAAIAAALALGSAVSFLLPPWMAQLKALPFCEQLPWMRGLIVALACAAVVAMALAAWALRRMQRLGQWPLPGTLLVRRTRVWRGAAVQSLAALLLCVLLACVAAFVWAVHRGWPIWIQLFSPVAGC